MRKLVAVLVCSVASLSAIAQSSSGAEAAMQEYMEATRTHNTQAMAALMHPDALKRFRTTIDNALSGPKAGQAEKELLPLFSVTTVSAYSDRSDVEAYKRLNDAVARAAPELITMMSASTYEIVGSFIEDDVAHVIYNIELTIQGNPVSSQVVQTLKMHDGKWFLMLPSTADATIVGIEARFK